MNKEKKKNIILISIAVFLIGIGCINFKTDNVLEVAADSQVVNDLHLGDVQLVNADVSNSIPENVYSSDIVPNDEIEEANTKIDENIVSTNTEVVQENEEYFSETRLQRDSMYSETIEIYQEMLENTDVPANQKAIATEEISNITNMKNAIMIAENLIKNKGFEDVVILENNGIVSVIVKSVLLTQEQVAKIQNVVSRELNIQIKNINISNK